MGTLVKIIVTLAIALFFSSCNFDIGEGKKGNGNVVTENRGVKADFTAVKASEGLDVYITQANEASITVEADDNIIESIQTDIENGELRIHTSERLGRAKSKKIFVTLPTIIKLESSSGAEIESSGMLKADKLKLSSSSGAEIKVNVHANEVNCDTSSGADIRVSGTTQTLIAEASSGSDIEAGELEAKNAIAKASSGADITVNSSDRLDAKSSSGGDIRYKGNPELVNNNKSFGGNVTKD